MLNVLTLKQRHAVCVSLSGSADYSPRLHDPPLDKVLTLAFQSISSGTV